MPNTLFIPIRVRQLSLTETTQVASATADFSGLPYYDPANKIIINNDRPFISENIISEPFEDDLHPLRAGNHLHFILPSQFTHFNSDGNNLPCPNRWLIDNGADNWVVESDYLSKTTTASQISVTTLIPVPDANAPGYGVYTNNGNTYYKPFRYLGRKLTLEDWQHLGNSNSATYWKDMYNDHITAFAHGDAQFPVFYPNCRSVWGFYDDHAAETAMYNVLGWFHYEADDIKNNIIPPILSSIYALISDVENDGTLQNAADQVNAFFGRAPDYEWNFDPANLGNPASLQEIKDAFDEVDEIVFYGNTIENQQELTEPPNVKLAIGNTGVEALSAFLAAETYPDSDEDRIQLENKLEAIQYDYLKGMTVDLGAKFEEARHAKGFKTISGSMLWDYSFRTQDGQKNLSQDQLNTISAFEQAGNLDQLTSLLNVLNAVQAQYETATRSISGKQQQLFAYWYKYMMAAHPPKEQQGKYMNPDEVLQFIQDWIIPDLDAAMAQTALLQMDEADASSPVTQQIAVTTDISINPDGTLDIKTPSSPQNIGSPINFVTDSGFLVIAMADYLSTVQPSEQAWAKCLFDQLGKIYEELLTLGDNNTLDQANLDIRIVKKPGARFYQPTDPTLLISGNVVPTDVNTENTVLKSFLSPMPTEYLDKAMTDYQSAGSGSLPTNVRTYLDQVKPQSVNLPWHPNLMEWEVAFYPMDDPIANPDGYNPDFLSNVFDLPSGQPEFTPISTNKNIELTSSISVYRGFAHLSPYALTYLSNKLSPYQAESPDEQLYHAYNQLQQENNGILSQSLSGFNQAFMMRKASLQLASIGDPVAFDDYKALIISIQEYIDNNIGTAPIPTNGFNPIRGGGLRITQLNLINNFGQKVNIYEYDPNNKTRIDVPQTMMLPSTTSTSITDQADAFLYPRYVQPTRLHARWLTKDSTGVECGVHYQDTPICGWVVHNILDDSLMLYNYEGNLLGSIAVVENAARLIPKPEATSFSLDDISSTHLRSFANYFVGPPVDNDYFQSFLILLSNAQEYIDPDTYAQHPELALLMGQPLALVRLKMYFELQGNPAYDESWSALQANIANSKSENKLAQTSDHLEEVEIPVRLGDYRQLNDGLVGFWVDGSNQNMDVQSDFYSPANDLYSNTNQAPPASLPSYFTSTFLANDVKSTAYQQSLQDGPQFFTMLFDPRAQLNISTGVLPVKTIKIPADLYKNSLENIRVTFLMSPMLTPKDALQFPVPNVAGYQWKWIYQENTSTAQHQVNTFPARDNIAQSVLETQWATLNTGITGIWDKLRNTTSIEGANPVLVAVEANVSSSDPLAYIYYNQVTSDNLALLLGVSAGQATTLTPELMQLLLQYHQGVDAVVTGAQFDPVEIREGWLALLEQPSTDS